MKLVYNTLNIVFNLCNGRNNYIVVESPYWFEKFIRELYESVTQKKEGFLLFDESDERLDMHKICEFIISPLDLSFDKREIQKKLFNELEVIVHDNGLIEDYCNIQSEIIQLFDALQELSEYDLDFYDEFDLLSWFKASNIHIKEPNGCFAEKIIEYIVTMKKLAEKCVFIIANCESFLDEKSYEYIEECAAYYDVCILFLSGRQIELKKSTHTYIIDKDLCEIR